METASADFDLHIQKSFSFSAFKESTLAFFSDDDDDEDQNDNPDRKNDDMADENSFIEIALDGQYPKIIHTTKEEPNITSNNPDHLRISFSSSFPSIPETAHPQPDPEIPVVSSSSSSSSSSSVRLSASSLRSSSTGTASSQIFPGSESFSLYESSRRRDHLPAFNPLVHTLLFSLESPQPPSPAVATGNVGDHDRNLGGGDRLHDWKDSHLQLAMINADIYRKASNNITTAASSSTGGNNQNGIMKLLMVKFRATKVRKLLSSLFTKSRGQANYLCNPNKVENDMSYVKKPRPYNYFKYSKETLIEPYYDQCHEEMLCYNSFGTTNDVKSSSHVKQRRFSYKPRALDMNLGAVRGVLEAVNMSGTRTSTARTNRRKTSSCPSSIKSSPIHLGFGGDTGGGFCTGENSIQDAIAHCKSSLGQSSEFRF